MEMAATARPTRRELLGEIRDVVTDLPVFLTAPLYRRWHLHWGATPAEIAEALAGDAPVPEVQFKASQGAIDRCSTRGGLAMAGAGRVSPRRLLQQ